MSDYSSNFPQQRPKLNLVFNSGSGKLDSRISYSRSSTGTYMSNEKALSSENLLLQSENLGTTWAVFTDLTSPTGNQTAPDGTSSAWLLTATTGANKSPSLSQNLVSGAGTHTLVAHLKAGSASHGFVSMRVSNGNIAYAMIDFSAGTSTHGSYGSVTNPSSTVTALGSNWYRLTLTATVSSGLAIAFIGISDGSAVQSSGYATDWSSSGETLYAWGAQLSSTNSKVYDSPTTTQISRKFAPTLKTSQSDQPRFEYSATDGQSAAGSPLGLLVESQATNLIPGSDDFSTGWSVDNLNIESSLAIAPTGTLSASLLRATGSTHHRIRRVLNVTSGNNYSASIYVKAAGYSHLFLGSGNTSTWAARAYFDVSNGTVGTVSNGTASIEDVGNGYYRCVINGTAGATAGVYLEINVCEQDNATSFTSNDFGGLLAFGLQFEEGAASSLISTSGASASRAADSCSVATADFGFTGGPVSVYADANAGAGSYPCVFALYPGATSSSSIRVFRNLPSSTEQTDFRFNVKLNTVSEVLLTPAGSGAVSKFAIRADTNSFAVKSSGLTQQSDTSCAMPVPDTLEIGGGPSVGQLNGTIRNLMLWNVAISDTELSALVD